jgi:hypothetical protein
MSAPGFNAARTWRTSQRIALAGSILCVSSYVAAAIGYGVAGAAPFVVGLFMFAYGKYQGGYASAFLSQFVRGDR